MNCSSEPSTNAQEWWPEAISNLSAGVITLSASSPDVANIDFTLEPGGSISGTVYESDGVTPIPNIGVNVDANGWGVGLCADGNGNYSFSALPFGVEFRVRASIPWLNCAAEPSDFIQEFWQEAAAWNDATILMLSSGTSTYNGIDFTLEPGGSVSGVVTDAATGQPLEGLEVWVPTLGGSVWTCTDANGYYSLTGLPVDTPLTIRAQSWSGCPGPQNYLEQSIQVTLPSGAPDLTDVDFALITC